MARRGGDASLNNAQMRSEVRRLRDYVQDLQARNAEQDYKIRELEKSTRKTRMTEMEIECEEYVASCVVDLSHSLARFPWCFTDDTPFRVGISRKSSTCAVLCGQSPSELTGVIALGKQH